MRDVVAERQILAMALAGHDSTRERFLSLPAEAFSAGRHDVVATVLRDKLRRGLPINALTVAADAASVVGTDHNAEQVQRFVMECSSSAPPLNTWGYYEERVRMCATSTKAEQDARRFLQKLDAADDTEQISNALRVVQEDLASASEGMVAAVTEPPMSLQALLDEEDEPHDWLVPGLWERMDRVIITGFEGTGKSFLLAQFGLTVAAGVHPFTAEVINRDGFRVLVLDCENSKRQIKRRYRQVRRSVDQLREMRTMRPIDWNEQLRFVMRPEGVDLGNAAELARVEAAIAATAPDLVVAGPLYRMHKMNINEEQSARELVDALDRLRVKYRFTLICEAHVGHGGEHTGGRKLRPTGSSLFLRWPEFGYGIRAFGDAQAEEHPSTVEVVAWRGSRDERNWPRYLKHGDTLPWTPSDPQYNAGWSDYQAA